MLRKLATQRGLSLVEVSVIMVIVGLLLGASIIPLGALSTADAYKQEEQKLEAVIDAVYGYALSHRTRARNVAIFDSGNNLARTVVTPTKRPHLPCPDANGDGHEDRAGFSAVGAQLPGGTLTVFASTNDLRIYGNCLVGRGVLPWKTLGLPPADHWGNRYTYEVDDVFSNAYVGFGQDIVADAFDVRSTLDVSSGNLFYTRRDALGSVIATGGLDYTNAGRPIVVCVGGENLPCTTDPGVGNRMPLAAGEAASVALTAPRRQYAAGDVTDGLPFVVVSHGKNGRGAVNHAASEAANAAICNAPVHSSGANAAAITVAAANTDEALNFPFAEKTLPDSERYCRPVSGFATNANGRFVSQPRTEEGFAGARNDSYDDLVVWQTRKQMAQTLSKGGILPVPEFPLLRDN